MKFTNEVPKKPGAYWWKGWPDDHGHELVYVTNTAICSKWGGLWCRLVPAEEVEKAYKEGHFATHEEGYYNSRARRVAQGMEP